MGYGARGLLTHQPLCPEAMKATPPLKRFLFIPVAVPLQEFYPYMVGDMAFPLSTGATTPSAFFCALGVGYGASCPPQILSTGCCFALDVKGEVKAAEPFIFFNTHCE